MSIERESGRQNRTGLLQDTLDMLITRGSPERECKYYRVTPLGRKQLAAEESKWNRLATAIASVMRAPVRA